MSILTVKNLQLKIGAESILESISFKLDQGRILAITGESGSGKTSLALAILKLINSEGSITFQNQNLQNLITKTGLIFLENLRVNTYHLTLI